MKYTIGQNIGKLTIVERIASRREGNKYIRARLLCKCECGNEVSRREDAISTSKVPSCGCVKAEAIGNAKRKHGLSHSPEHNTWLGIRNRCNNPKVKAYEYYGGRGIRVCDEWNNSFEAFYRDMGAKPTSKHSIDRLDNNGHYCKENCKWVTVKEQANNKSYNVPIEYNGEIANVTQWCERYNQRYMAVYKALRRGVTIADIIDQNRYPLHPL